MKYLIYVTVTQQSVNTIDLVLKLVYNVDNELEIRFMPKLKISILVEIEYDADPKHYPAGFTPEQMLATDIVGAEEDPYLFIDMDNAKMTISGEILK